MEKEKCINCAHFRQHYVYWYENHYQPVPCGHCVYPRLKHRTPDTSVCVHYKEKPSPLEPVAGQSGVG